MEEPPMPITRSKFTQKFWMLVMGSAVVVYAILLIAFCTPTHAATTFEWNRNTETDVDHYEMFGCSTSATCTPGTTPADKIGIDVPQPAIGIKPTMPIPANTQGRAAVIAIDLSGNRSGLSNIVPFVGPDTLAPVNPTGLLTK